MTELKDRPGIKRKLTGDQKVTIMNLAMTRFIDQEKRAATKAAYDAFVKALLADNQSVVRDLEVLQRHVRVSAVNNFSMPTYNFFRETVGAKTFELPNGSSIERPERESRTYVLPPEEVGFYQIAQLRALANGEDIVRSGYLIQNLPEGEVLHLPVINHLRFFGEFAVSESAQPWITDETKKIGLDYYKVADEQREAEVELWKAFATLLLSANHYADIHAFWPEVEETLDELFPMPMTSGFRLVAISDEQKAKLCANMQGRGVNSGLCAA